MTPGSADVSGRSPGTREPGSDRSTPAAAATTSVRLDSLIGSLLKTTHRGQHRDVSGRSLDTREPGSDRSTCNSTATALSDSAPGAAGVAPWWASLSMPRHPIRAAPVESLRAFA